MGLHLLASICNIINLHLVVKIFIGVFENFQSSSISKYLGVVAYAFVVLFADLGQILDILVLHTRYLSC